MLGALLREEAVESLPPHITAVYVHNAFKVFIRACQPHRSGGADDADLAAVISCESSSAAGNVPVLQCCTSWLSARST
jgi:hypothetical protein